MKALYLLVQNVLPRLSFFKSRSKGQGREVKNFGIDRKLLSQVIHLCNIKALSPFVKKLWSRLSLLWTDEQTYRRTDRQTGWFSQPIRYARACSSYECFILRARRLSSKLLKQGYLVERLKSSFRKFYGRYGDLIQQYEVSLSRMLNEILTLDQQWLPNQSDFPPISWPWYRLSPSPNYEWFPWEKGKDLTQSYDKSPYTSRIVKRAKWQHKQRHKKVRLHSGCGPT